MTSPVPAPSLNERATRLTNLIDRQLKKWIALVTAWGVAYIVFILVTIAFPIVIASKDDLSKAILGDIASYVPYLALVTAIAVALDQVVHFQTMWLWYRSDRRAARQLREDLDVDPPRSEEELAAYRKRWLDLDNLNGTHRIGMASNVEPKAPAR